MKWYSANEGYASFVLHVKIRISIEEKLLGAVHAPHDGIFSVTPKAILGHLGHTPTL